MENICDVQEEAVHKRIYLAVSAAPIPAANGQVGGHEHVVVPTAVTQENTNAIFVTIVTDIDRLIGS
jgi:hypothetical protein